MVRFWGKKLKMRDALYDNDMMKRDGIFTHRSDIYQANRQAIYRQEKVTPR